MTLVVNQLAQTRGTGVCARSKVPGAPGPMVLLSGIGTVILS